MEIKSREEKSLIIKVLSFIKKYLKQRRFSFSLAIFVIYSFVLLGLGALIHKTEIIGLVIKPIIKQNIKVPINYLKSFNVKMEHFVIDINYENYQKLAYKREVALAHKILLTSSDDYVPATIRYNDTIFRVAIRLKGDWTDHIDGDKWSFRIKVRGDNTILGMKRFSLQHPKTRNYIYEWIYHQALKRQNLIPLRYKFVKVTLNGKNLGIYALEEHFEKRLIEYNKNREAPIIKFNEDTLWTDGFIRGDVNNITNLQKESSADIDAFGMNTIFNNPSLYKQFVTAKDLLESFRRGLLPAYEVFDIKKMAKYFAISEVMGGFHGPAHWTNLRFYYNPLTSLLEPIGFDVDAGKELGMSWDGLFMFATTNVPGTSPIKIFKDRIFFEEYIRELCKVSKKGYLDELFSNIDKDLNKNLNILYREFPYYIFSKDILYQNQKVLRALLNPSKAIHAYFNRANKDYIELALGNIHSLPVEILGISHKDFFVALDKKVILYPRFPSELVNYQPVRFSLSENIIWSEQILAESKVKYRLLGTDTIKYASIFAYSYLSDNFVENDFMRRPSNVHEFEFLSVNETTKQIAIKPGRWNINKSLIISQGYTVICPEGVELNISNSATVLSFSPLEFVGSPERSIFIYSKDTDGYGLVVIGAGRKSVLKYVVFKNLSNPAQQNWELTGAITFYESPVDIEHCQFLNNNAEDSLNIIRSEFLISKTLFEESYSDALDVDFSKGKIKDSTFLNCGNDAIDASGSLIDLKGILVDGASDKALSVGENSKITADLLEIKNAQISLASKDSSELDVGRLVLSDCAIDFAVYRKKPEFDFAYMNINKLTINREISPLVEEGSQLIIEGRRIEPNQKNLKETLY